MYSDELVNHLSAKIALRGSPFRSRREEVVTPRRNGERHPAGPLDTQSRRWYCVKTTRERRRSFIALLPRLDRFYGREARRIRVIFEHRSISAAT